jgi:hypothetical protein
VRTWLVLVALGTAVESVLLGTGTAAIGSSPSLPVPVWALALWLGLVAPGLAVAVAQFARPARLAAGSRRPAVIVTGVALSVLTACVSGLVLVLIGNLHSAHLVESGRPVTAWLEPGVYQASQDPANGGFNTGLAQLSLFSVTGRGGLVPVTPAVSVISPADVGGLFVGGGRDGYDFFSQGQFRIARPGEYRLVNDDKSIYPAVLVTPPYGAVVTRTLPWIAGSQAAFWTMLGSLAFTRGKLRRRVPGSVPPGPG